MRTPPQHKPFRVVLTGTRAEPLSAALRAEGFEVVHRPLVEIEPLGGPPIDVGGYDWLLVTSRNAVEPLLARADGPLPSVAAIGAGTAAALRAHGVEPTLVARRPTQEGLVAELPKPSGRVLFAGAEGARDLLVRELGADFVALYRTVEVDAPDFPDADLAVVSSPSAARALARAPAHVPCVVAGPVTAGEARRVGLRIAAEASSPDPDGVAEAVKLAASANVSSRS